jgi:hypothetical protein
MSRTTWSECHLLKNWTLVDSNREIIVIFIGHKEVYDWTLVETEAYTNKLDKSF